MEAVAAYVESDLDKLDDESLQAHLDRVNRFFRRIAYDTDGVLTYYYRIDPSVSSVVEGFWFVGQGSGRFVEHEVTHIPDYDTGDTSSLVWFTVPKATGNPLWLPPYVTENLGVRVISYNMPIYHKGKFVGVVGAEIDCSTMEGQVDAITLYDNGYAFVNDDAGRIVYHPRIDVVDVPQEGLPTPPAGVLGAGPFVRYTYEGVRKVAAWLPLANGMRLNVTVPIDEINAGWMRWAIDVTAVFALMLVASGAIVLRLANGIVGPLEEAD